MGVGSRVTTGMSRLKRTQQRKSDERFAERFAQQWATIRADRRPEEPVGIQAGESNYARAKVPYGVDLAAAWSWRVLVMVGAGYVVVQGISKFAVVVLPLVIALLLAALVVPVVDAFVRLHIPRGVAALMVVLG